MVDPGLEREVEEKTSGVKRFRTADGGTVALRYESVLSPAAQDQRLVVYTPADDGGPSTDVAG